MHRNATGEAESVPVPASGTTTHALSLPADSIQLSNAPSAVRILLTADASGKRRKAGSGSS